MGKKTSEELKLNFANKTSRAWFETFNFKKGCTQFIIFGDET